MARTRTHTNSFSLIVKSPSTQSSTSTRSSRVPNISSLTSSRHSFLRLSLVDISGKGSRACVFFSISKFQPPRPAVYGCISRHSHSGSTYYHHNVRLLDEHVSGPKSARDRRPLAMQSRPKLTHYTTEV